MEIWKDIEGYEGLYQISNMGNVKSMERYCDNKKGVFLRKEKILKLGTDTAGYKKVSIYKNSKRSTILVHRVIAKAFIENPENKPFINHINSVKGDNKIENLEWCTQGENMQHASKMGRISKKIGEDNYFFNNPINAKSVFQIDLYGNCIAKYNSIAEAGMYTGINPTNISRVCNLKRDVAGGYKWVFVKSDETLDEIISLLKTKGENTNQDQQ